MHFMLKELMAKRHWSIETVKRGSGVSRTTLTNLYYGRSKGIQLDTLLKLCSFFGVTPNEFIEKKSKEA